MTRSRVCHHGNLNRDPTETEHTTPESPSRETVIEQAKKFLEEEEVRNASTDKKISFLEGKGLNSEEITELLGITRNQEATAPPQVSPSLPQRNRLLTVISDPTTSSQSISTTHIYLSPNPRHAPNNNLSRIPHHPTTSHPSSHKVPPSNNTLPLRRTIRPAIRHKHLPRRTHARLTNQLPTLPRRNHIRESAETYQ
jgi:hypothetical protein